MSDDSPREITKIAIGEFVEALRPLTTIMTDAYARERVLGELGVPIGSPSQPPQLDFTKLDTYAGATATATEDPDAAAFQEALEDVWTVVDALRVWAATLQVNPQDTNQFFSLILTVATTSYVRDRHPVLWCILRLVGLVEDRGFGHAIPTWELNRLGEFWSDGGHYFAQRYNHDSDAAVQAGSDALFIGYSLAIIKFQRDLSKHGVDVGALYGWDLPSVQNISDADRLSNRSFTVRFRLKQEVDGVTETGDLFVNFMLIPKPHGGGWFITFKGGSFGFTAKDYIGNPGWHYELKLPSPSISLWMADPGFEVVSEEGAEIGFKATPPSGIKPWRLLEKGSRIELSPNGFGVEFKAGKSAARFALKTAIIISTGDADSFIGKMVGASEFTTELDLTFVFSSKGIGFEGALGLQIVIPVSKAINLGATSITLQQVTLGIVMGTEGFKFEAGVAISLKLGPLTLVVEQIGFHLLNSSESDGWTIGFKPPKGMGVSIGTSSVGGGGYLFWDLEQEQYAGSLLLAIEGLATLKAVGILTTRLPDDPDGFSLLIIISAEFTPIQLGFGFMLSGIGGLLGINRTVIPEAMRAGVKNRTLDAIMFPKDPVGNAPVIVSQLNNVFPPADQRYTFGLMVQIRWATMLRMDLGLIVEIPAPIRVIILGKMSLFAPHEFIPLVELHLDVVGILDFGACEISIDASLYDSHVLYVLTITGDMALRASWGDNADFAVSVGGFHPKFVPPANFPHLERAAITISTGNNPRIRTECYYALTSNSLQMGARAELYAAAGGFSVLGFIGWDLLIQFDPFGFRADFSAGLALQAAGVTLMSVTVEGTLCGFSPLWVSGSASFTLLFFTVSFGFKFTLVEGSAPPSALPVDVLAMLVAELKKGQNWSAQLPPQFAALFALREVFSETDVIVHPLAQLAVKQTVVPLGLTIEKFGESEPAGESSFQINSVKIGNSNVTTTSITAAFAPGQFYDLDDAKRLTRPSFEQMQAGVQLGILTGQHGKAIEKSLTYETKVVQPETEFVVFIFNPYQITQKKLDVFTRSGAVARSDAQKTGKKKYAAPKIGVTYHETQYAVTSMIDRTKSEDQPELRSYSMVKQAMREQQGQVPDSYLQIVHLEEALTP